MGTLRDTGERPFQCAQCPSVFTKASSFQSHVKRKHSAGAPHPFSCPGCSAAFLTSYDLTQHARTHTGERPFQCAQCPSVFTKAGSLRSHASKKHSSGTTLLAGVKKKRPFSCPPSAPPRSPPATT